MFAKTSKQAKRISWLSTIVWSSSAAFWRRPTSFASTTKIKPCGGRQNRGESLGRGLGERVRGEGEGRGLGERVLKWGCGVASAALVRQAGAVRRAPPRQNSSSHLRAGIVVSPERSYAFLSANVPDAKSHFIEPAAGERELGVSP